MHTCILLGGVFACTHSMLHFAVFELFRSAAGRGWPETGPVKATSPHLPKGAILHCPVHHYTIGNQTLEYASVSLRNPLAGSNGPLSLQRVYDVQ
jgi:hypothetical protein